MIPTSGHSLQLKNGSTFPVPVHHLVWQSSRYEVVVNFSYVAFSIVQVDSRCPFSLSNGTGQSLRSGVKKARLGRLRTLVSVKFA